ncbi:hypothetical protein ALC60_14136 [Trachymyrmex zeteki]|uniref:Uncharacterized protein n=1 Tax=Mycetomoellerius zeteki TaxID=64791 RepID=A0A151WGB2_9HYME|nr:hypothetical protein ALC60_14136 [Trachymyrmex zeteki]
MTEINETLTNKVDPIIIDRSNRIDSIRLLLALMKWTARFMKRWHSKNGYGHGENPRNG